MKSVDTRYMTANIPIFLIRSLVKTLGDFNLDASRLFVGLGLTIDDLDDPACRVSFRQGREAIFRATQMARGHALGLETGFREKITSVGFVGYAMLTAPTVGEAVKLGFQFQRDTGSMLEFDTRPTKEGIIVTATSRFHDPEIYTFLVEEAFASFMGIAVGLVGEEFRPLKVNFAYPPPTHAAAYHRVFGCAVEFGQMENAFLYDPVWYKRPLATADPFTHRQILEFMAFNRTRSREAAEITESVERVLRQKLQDRITIAKVARALGMSERTLRRRLAENDVSFQSLLDGLRKNRALELLANPQMSVEQIAFAAGFTDPHNFRRAFRRWTGSTPGALRNHMSSIWPE
ncbi:AraC family transcriptional regulator [Agrobacterium rubi]|uniref:AraC family transcriptional regulator n=1 Tax=Agrobacterium rubi TaxID=28099 RepID=UPI00157247E2|nr:AraC family transcriptional regulator [Agrobacterium rubi]NTF09585.1 AraC family transcriptional regulator [Agrobacterium rubi]NTF22492.1 AraC family transcriptional regulator [Agrobacterium rubi]NTF29349.1 AraC family transcriptional regulator [Agrobacterium rubi]